VLNSAVSQLPVVTSHPRFVGKLKAWMLALPVDLIALSLPALWNWGHVRAVVCFALISVVLLAGAGRYRARLHVSLLDEMPSLIGRVLLAAAVVGCITALRHASGNVTSFLRVSIVSIVLLVAGRACVNAIILYGRRTGRVAHRTLIIGGGPLGSEMARMLIVHPQYGLNVVGYVDDQHEVDAFDALGVPWAGPISALDSGVVRSHSEVLLLADPVLTDSAMLEPLRHPAPARCDLLVVPRLRDFHTQAGLVDHIGAIPVMRIRHPGLRGPAWLAKRLFDVVLSALALVALLPVLLACALAVRVLGGREVLFRQQRLTREGRPFEVIKFRSMKPVDPEEANTMWSIGTDSRVSSVGRFLRRTSLDELPQLWNILRGDMTIVGPRPERPFFAEKFSAELPGYSERFRVPCGLTGLAQVSGLRGDTSIPDRARYDNFYIENWSLWLDVKVVLRTLREVVSARGC
jgi:exopolysaccharide biosynthesis polyprenyl glycosylphosphotransferase